MIAIQLFTPSTIIFWALTLHLAPISYTPLPAICQDGSKYISINENYNFIYFVWIVISSKRNTTTEINVRSTLALAKVAQLVEGHPATGRLQLQVLKPKWWIQSLARHVPSLVRARKATHQCFSLPSMFLSLPSSLPSSLSKKIHQVRIKKNVHYASVGEMVEMP